MEKYDDIKKCSKPIPKKHKQMSVYNRAAQFSSFAALVGYFSVIDEEGRLTKEEIELNEDQKIEIDRVLQCARDNKNVKVNMVYFIKDRKKAGGEYLNIEGVIKKINEDNKTIYFEDKRKVQINNIIYASLL